MLPLLTQTAISYVSKCRAEFFFFRITGTQHGLVAPLDLEEHLGAHCCVQLAFYHPRPYSTVAYCGSSVI
jgi:hypothetical protein